MAVWQPDSTWATGRKGLALPGSADEDAAPGRFAALLARLNQEEAGRLMIWSPLLLVLGIWTYFALPREPVPWIGLLLCMVALAALAVKRHRLAIAVPAIIVLGFATAQLRSHWVETPLLRAFTPSATVTGYVREVDVRSRGRVTLVLDVTQLAGVPPDEVPRAVRLSVSSKQAPPLVGDALSITADLAPLPRPAAPGMFDFGRTLYFQSIGAVGRSHEDWTEIATEVPLRYRLDRAFHGLRAAIGSRIREVISGPLGSFADALVTGERASIPRAMNTSLQSSGLYHILSISGLHMSLVAGGTFWLVRALLALNSLWALNAPIKKWAAAAAVAVGALYMLLADSGPATERSFLMIAIVFFAVMVDRPALSMHNLALAAVVILLSAPEQAMAASFQMSFMAVMGLAAFFAWWQARSQPEPQQQAPGRAAYWSRKLAHVVLASLATSLVAGTLSAIPALHHFGRFAPYGVVANALALPVVGIIVMPMAMLAVFAMPLGLEALPLQALAAGLRMVMAISDWVASWPAASATLPLISAGTAACLALGAAFICLPRGLLRWLCVPLLAAAAASHIAAAPATILVDERAATVAIATGNGLVPADARFGASSAGRWLKAQGDQASVRAAAARPGWACAGGICRATVNGASVAYLASRALPAGPCPVADIVISQAPLRAACKGRLATVDRFDVWRQGAFALHVVDGAVRMETVRQSQGARPWVYRPRARSRTP